MELTTRVLFGSLQHILPILLTIVLGFAVILYAKNKHESIQIQVFKLLGVFVSGVMVVFHGYQISKGGYSLQTDLPLFLCSFMALFIVTFTATRRFVLFEFLVFWVIIGTTQGVITPEIEVGFPSFDYFRYWVVHLGLILIIAYAIVVFKMKPNLKSVIKSFIGLQVYLLILMGINKLLDANYGYLNQKPKSATILDYFGEWPTYVITAQLILIPAFFLIYFPFFLVSKKNKNAVN